MCVNDVEKHFGRFLLEERWLQLFFVNQTREMSVSRNCQLAKISPLRETKKVLKRLYTERIFRPCAEGCW